MATLLLLACGDPVTLEFYRVSLEGASFRVIATANAQEASRLAASLIPDIVIIDGTDIPRVEFCRELDRGARTRGIPVLALGRPGRGLSPRWSAGGTCELEMPVPRLPDALVQEIDRQLTRSAARRRPPPSPPT